jgi:hypothetical protein
MNTSTYLRRFSRLLILGAVIAGATASVAGAVGRPPNISDAATANATVPDVFERYAASHPYGTPVPDVLERYAASHPYGTPVPDVLERYAASHPYGTPVSPPQQVGVPLYTPERLAAHFDHEDLLYTPRPSLSATPRANLSQGFDWSDWAIGLGSGIALILGLGGVLAFARQWRHRLQTA